MVGGDAKAKIRPDELFTPERDVTSKSPVPPAPAPTLHSRHIRRRLPGFRLLAAR